MKPYTYLIRWTKLNISYYGVRYAQDCNPSDLWNPYKTSSKHVAKFIAEHGEPDVVQVRKTFIEVTVAQNWEHRVLKRMKVVSSDRWLNRTDNKSISPQYGEDHPHKKGELSHMYGVKRPDISDRQKERFANKNHQFLDPTVRAKAVVTRSGDRHHMKRPAVAEKVSGENHYSKKEGYVCKTSGSNNPMKLGYKYRKIICQYCDKEYGASGLNRHENFCKNNLTNLVVNTDQDVYNNLAIN
jgi:hypothetical protein